MLSTRRREPIQKLHKNKPDNAMDISKSINNLLNYNKKTTFNPMLNYATSKNSKSMEINNRPETLGLVIPTYGRTSELNQLLESIWNQPNIPEKIVIIDQNEYGFLDQVIMRWSNRLPIEHRRVTFKSASKARNLGVKLLQTDIITFPDDDCIFVNDTIGKIKDAFHINPLADIIIGQKRRSPSSRRGGDEKAHTRTIENILDLFKSKAETSNIFCKRSSLSRMSMIFDEKIGPGDHTIISNEETDLLIRMLRKNAVLITYTGIQIDHHSSQVSYLRSLKYGEGRFELIRRQQLGIFYYLLNLLQPLFRLARKPSLQGLLCCSATMIGRSGITRVIPIMTDSRKSRQK